MVRGEGSKGLTVFVFLHGLLDEGRMYKALVSFVALPLLSRALAG